MKEDILYIILSTIMAICIVLSIAAWVALMAVGIIDIYDKNPNGLFVIIPFIIFVHVYGYLTLTRR